MRVRKVDLGENAPISEALIDVFVSLPPSVSHEDLKRAGKAIEAHYPRSRARRRWEGKVTLQGSGKSLSEEHSSIDGWIFSSDDGLDVVQFRLDGFTVNRLRPYAGWEQLLERARAAWSIYLEKAKPVRTDRLAVRYLNRLKLPLPAELDQYFSAAPKVPSALPQQIDSYLSRVVIPNPMLAASGTVTQTCEPCPDRGSVTAVLDIEVSAREAGLPDPETIWPRLGTLREFKNELFFGFLTAFAVERLLAGELR